jgi:hypothetical protein
MEATKKKVAWGLITCRYARPDTQQYHPRGTTVDAKRRRQAKGGKMATGKNRLALLLAFALLLAGCNGSSVEKGYTFRFKVDNDTNLNGGIPKTIAKIEFINGDRQNDRVLEWDTQPVAPGERSAEYRVSGFTVEYDYSTCKGGVRVTFDDETSTFNWDAFGHGNRILVTVSSDFRNGDFWNPIDFSLRDSW